MGFSRMFWSRATSAANTDVGGADACHDRAAADRRTVGWLSLSGKKYGTAAAAADHDSGDDHDD